MRWLGTERNVLDSNKYNWERNGFYSKKKRAIKFIFPAEVFLCSQFNVLSIKNLDNTLINISK